MPAVATVVELLHILDRYSRALYRLRRWRLGQDGDESLAHRVAGLDLISVRQLEIQLVGGNLHWLTAGARLLGLRILPHAGVLHHVKMRRLVLILEVHNERIRGAVRHAGAVAYRTSLRPERIACWIEFFGPMLRSPRGPTTSITVVPRT